MASNGNELPVVAGWMECQFEYPMDVVLADLAVRERRAEGIGAGICAACANNKLADPPPGVGGTARVLWSESLIFVFMAVEHDVGTVIVEGLPERLHRGLTPVHCPGTEARLVPIGQRTGGRVRRQVCP